MKAINTFQIAVRWQGQWRLSSEYATVEEAHANLLPFMRQFAKNNPTVPDSRGVYLQFTFYVNTRWINKDPQDPQDSQEQQ